MDQLAVYPSSIQYPRFVVTFLPFERTLLDSVLASDCLINEAILASPNEEAIAVLFHKWKPAETTRGGLLDLADEISRAEAEEAESEVRGQLTPSVEARERCYRAFIGILDSPSYSNEGRGMSADKHNETFRTHFLQAVDISNLLKLPSELVTANFVEDRRHWEVLAAMTTRFPGEMELWTSGMQLTGESLPLRSGFEIWQVTRMYLTHLLKPDIGSLLLNLLQRRPYQDLGERLWEEKKKENQRAKQGWEIFIAEREALRKGAEGEESVQNSERETNEDVEIYRTFDVRYPFQFVLIFQTTEKFVDHVDATNRTANRFSNEKEEFLFRTLGFGHLNLHQAKEVEFISSDKLYSMLGSQKAERWFSELLDSMSNEECHIACLPVGETKTPYQRLFFSEAYVFQHYIETQRLPILNLVDLGRVVLVTDLPCDRELLQLEPRPTKFWENLVTTKHLYH